MSRKKFFFPWIFAVILIAISIFPLDDALPLDSAEELYEAALFKKEADGDLQGAIQLFLKIITKFPENRKMGAKAQLQIGICYEKLGLKKAQKAYQKVINNFPEQKESVLRARKRLSFLLRAQDVEKKEKIGEEKIPPSVWAGFDVDIFGAPSPDGRFLSCVDESGNLALREIATEKKRRLPYKRSWPESPEHALFSRWSPDSKRIVYNWYNTDGFFELRIVGLDGSEPRIIYRDEKKVYVQPYDWSSDGKFILALLTRKDGTNQITQISVLDGSSNVLKTLARHYPLNMSFSPDGRYVVYDYPEREDSSRKDIFLLDILNNKEITLVEHPANDFYPVWAADGRKIIFFSDRTGTVDIWIVQYDEGKPLDIPLLLIKNIGKIWPMGITKNGDFYYGITISLNDIFIATLDLDKGKVLAPIKKISWRFSYFNTAPAYSPDGQNLAYISQQRLLPVGWCPLAITIHSLKTGQERELSPKLIYSPRLIYFYQLRWARDCNAIFILGLDLNNRWGVYRVDIQSGDTTPILLDKAKPGIRSFFLSPDEKTIFYSRQSKNLVQIMAQDLENGQEKELFKAVNPSSMSCFALSPDGSQVVYATSSKETEAVKLMPAQGGKSSELFRVKRREGIVSNFLAWMPDGGTILFGRQQLLNRKSAELWRIPVKGGKPLKLNLELEGLSALAVHPDSRRLAFSGGSQTAEVFSQERFFPKAPLAQQTGLEFLTATYYGGLGDELGTGIALKEDKIYISGEGPGYKRDGLVARYSGSIHLDWSAYWPNQWGPGEKHKDQFYDIALSSEGVYLAGYTESYASDGLGRPEHKALLVKFPLTGPGEGGVGGCEWYSSPNLFPYRGFEEFRTLTAVSEDDKTFIYAAGSAEASSSNVVAILVKYDTNGNQIWSQSLSDIEWNKQSGCNDIVWHDGFLYIAGYTSYYFPTRNQYKNRFFLLKCNKKGEVIWSVSQDFESAAFALAASENFIYVTGQLRQNGQKNQSDVFILKYDTRGNLIWTKFWSRGGAESAQCIAVDGNILFVGGQTEILRSVVDIFLLQVEAKDGSILSVNYWGDTGDDIARDIAVYESDIYLVGETTSTRAGDKDLVLLRFRKSSGEKHIPPEF